MTVYYVDTAVGNDSNAGTSEGAGNAWATIDKAMNTVIADDKVWVKASGTYSETPVMDTAGGITTPIIFEGYTTTTGDNGKVTISGATNCMTSALNAAYYIFRNFIFSGASGTGVQATSMDNCSWINCEFNTNGGDGCALDASHVFVNCVATGNTSRGFEADGGCKFIGCIAYANGASQIFDSGSALVYRCVGYGGTGSSNVFELNGASNVIANTIDGENAATIGLEATNVIPAIIDNVVYDCVTGISLSASIRKSYTFIGYNLVNSNTTDYSQTGENIGYQDVTGAPAFTDEAGDDYTLGDASPAIDAGIQPGGIT